MANMARSPPRRERDREHREHRDHRRSRSRGDRDHRDRHDDSHRRRRQSRDRHDDRNTTHRRRSRERSPEREHKRSRDARSPVRDRRDDRDRYRDSRDIYDDRDRKRPRHGDYRPRSSHGRLSPRPDDRVGSRRTFSSIAHNNHQFSSSPSHRTPSRHDQPLTEEEKIAQRRAKLQRLKEAEKGVEPPKTISENNGNTIKTSSDSNGATSKSTMPSILAAGGIKPSRRAYEDDGTAPKKFDPAEITKRARAALDRDRITYNPSSTGKSAATADPQQRADPHVAFGSSKTTNTGTLSTKAAEGLDEGEADTRRKLELLPSMLPANESAPYHAQDDDGSDFIGSDDERDAARKVAEKRAQQAQDEPPKEVDNDVTMEDEDDPLDAFMANLEKPPDEELDILADIRKGKSKQRRAYNSDDDDQGLEAMGMEELDTVVVKKNKKSIPKIDHSKMKYRPFRKQFYNEGPELAELSDADAAELRLELDNTTVSGNDVPKPITSFPQGGFGAQILDVIASKGYEKPTSIQAQALPVIMSGRDTLGIAKTGSGKTMAYLLPLFRHVKDQPPLTGLDGPIALVLAPTRELALQIHKDCTPFVTKLGLRACCAYGGAPISDQIADLKRGAEIIVATPGRLIDLLCANNGRVTNLSRVTYLVLDEADRMFDMGFEPQITGIMDSIRPDRQTVLFSATFPKSMDALARRKLNKAVHITVGGRSVVAPEIEQIIEVVATPEKLARLLKHLGENHKVDNGNRSLIFVDRHEAADILHSRLNKAGYVCYSIHGGREQMDRDQFISDFKKGIVPVLVATSVAARGLDVQSLSLVVNFDCPNHREDYVHRCGRTGRAGNKGTAVTFVQPDQDRYAPWLIRALTDSEKEVPPKLKEMAEAFDKKVKSGEVKKNFNVGFGGRGIERIDAARDQDRAQLRRQYFGDDEGVEQSADDKKKAEAKKAETDKLLAAASTGVKARDNAAASDDINSGIREDYAQLLREGMVVHRTEQAAPAKKEPNLSHLTAVQRAQLAAQKLDGRLSMKGTHAGQSADNHGPDAGAFHAKLKINDFPQKARWSVTNRSNVVKILEATGTSITSKGQYYAPGTEPGPTDQPKLYILVEGDTENAVQDAMHQLENNLREGMRMEELGAQAAPASGRYSVM